MYIFTLFQAVAMFITAIHLFGYFPPPDLSSQLQRTVVSIFSKYLIILVTYTVFMYVKVLLHALLFTFSGRSLSWKVPQW